jgi:hypothetical protein
VTRAVQDMQRGVVNVAATDDWLDPDRVRHPAGEVP